MKSGSKLVAVSFAAALALGAGACGGSTASSAGAASPSATSSAPASSDSATAAPPASGAPAASAGAGSTSTTASGIVMPAGVGGVTYTSSEYTGDKLAMFLPMKSDELDKVLDAQGKTRADVVLALSAPDDPAWPTIAAIKVKGIGAQALVDQIRSGGYTMADWKSATVGGKSVQKAEVPTVTTVAYETGDTMYLVTALDPSHLDAVVATLP